MVKHHKCFLEYHACFGYMLEEFLDWISTTVKEVEEYHNNFIPHYLVLVAHNGFTFDFQILYAD